MRTLKMLTAAAAIAALAGGTAIAQQTVDDSGTDANGPITILKNMQAERAGAVTVTVDGVDVDDLSVATYDDITTTVHRGTNTVTVTWNGPITRMNFAIAYAPTRNKFKNVLVVQSTSQKDAALRQGGSRKYTFAIPG